MGIDEKTQRLLDALKPFVEAYNTWSGGNAQEHFASAVCPADFRNAANAVVGIEGFKKAV